MKPFKLKILFWTCSALDFELNQIFIKLVSFLKIQALIEQNVVEALISVRACELEPEPVPAQAFPRESQKSASHLIGVGYEWWAQGWLDSSSVVEEEEFD